MHRLISVFVIRCLDSIIPPFFYIRKFKPLASHCDCACRFESTLVAYAEDRFSRDEAHNMKLKVMTKILTYSVCAVHYKFSVKIIKKYSLVL